MAQGPSDKLAAPDPFAARRAALREDPVEQVVQAEVGGDGQAPPDPLAQGHAEDEDAGARFATCAVLPVA